MVGAFSLAVQGEIRAVAKVDNVSVADVTFSQGIEISNHTFHLGSADAYLELTSFSEDFSGKGTMKVGQVSVSASGINAQSFLIYCQEPVLFGKPLGESILFSKNPTQGYTAEVSIQNELQTSVAGVQISMSQATFLGNLKGRMLYPGLKDTKLSVKAGDNTIHADIALMKLGEPIQIDRVALENQRLTEIAQSAMGVDGFQLEVQNLTISPIVIGLYRPSLFSTSRDTEQSAPFG